MGNSLRRKVILAIALIAMATSAYAFHTPYHAYITVEALQSLGFDPATLTLINQGNTETDTDPGLFNTSAAHFDSEKFSAGSARLRAKFEEALKALQNCDRKDALKAIGTSLHAIQDFYSHSNYLELFGPDKPSAVDLFKLKDPPASAVCTPQGGSATLTTGYWPETPRVPGKCSHDDLAKDNESAGPRYFQARKLAVQASALYIQKMIAAIRSKHPNAAAAIFYLMNANAPPPPDATCRLPLARQVGHKICAVCFPLPPGTGMEPVIRSVHQDFLSIENQLPAEPR